MSFVNWIKSRALYYLTGIRLRMMAEREDDTSVPLPPKLTPKGEAMRQKGLDAFSRAEEATVPDIPTQPLKGSLADRLNKARKQ